MAGKNTAVFGIYRDRYGTAAGAVTGAALGGALGWLAGIGALAIPGVGPFLFAQDRVGTDVLARPGRAQARR